MNSNHESNSVHQAIIDQLGDQGWQVARTSQARQKGCDLWRTSSENVVLVNLLERQLRLLNPGLNDHDYSLAMQEICTHSTTQSLYDINREKYELIRTGVTVTGKDANGRKCKHNLKLIDFDQPANNHFLLAHEFNVSHQGKHKQADFLCFVNGLPLVVVECKATNKNIRNALSRNLFPYRKSVPHLFHFNAFMLISNGIDSKIGTITSNVEHFHAWKRIHEDDPANPTLRTMLAGVFTPANFLDLIENFILFDESKAEKFKVVARNHQFLGVNRAFEAIQQRQQRNRKLGTFWHTQGSGKSYSMVMLARKVLRRIGNDFTFLVLTDRNDLDRQIRQTFNGCDLVDNDRDPCHASSANHLRELLAQHKNFVFSTIHKFTDPVERGQEYSLRNNIVVFSDEAHRTQAGTLALNMRAAIPNANYLGFTGTPLLDDSEITRNIFGDYVSVYDFQRAVEDNATVPLYYQARGDALQVTHREYLDEIANVIAQQEHLSETQRRSLEQEVQRPYNLMTNPSRLQQIAQDFVHHFAASLSNGKAMFVCLDKATCIKMYDLAMPMWQAHIHELQRQLATCDEDTQSAELQQQIDLMKTTEFAVVVSPEANEEESLRKHGVDIKPHRELMQKGMAIPADLRKDAMQSKSFSLDEAFKHQHHPLRCVFVCAMWLTGFDVPSMSTLYLDKPLKTHNLMQTIARTNRVYKDKVNGMIVDYCGILDHLRAALARYGQYNRHRETQGEVQITQPDEQLLAQLQMAAQNVRANIAGLGACLDDAIQASAMDRLDALHRIVNAVNLNRTTRQTFKVHCNNFFRVFRACITLDEVHDYRPLHDTLQKIDGHLNNNDPNQQPQVSVQQLLQNILNLAQQAIDTQANRVQEEVARYDLSRINYQLLTSQFPNIGNRNSELIRLIDGIQIDVENLTAENPSRVDLHAAFEQIVARYNDIKDPDRVAEIFAELMQFHRDMEHEKGRAAREGLTEETLAIYDLLKVGKPEEEPEHHFKDLAKRLLETLKAGPLQAAQWTEKEETRAEVRGCIDAILDAPRGLPASYSKAQVAEIIDVVYQHLHEHYA